MTPHEATAGQPERSPVYVSVMLPNRMAQELMVALRFSIGEIWAVTRLSRGPGGVPTAVLAAAAGALRDA